MEGAGGVLSAIGQTAGSLYGAWSQHRLGREALALERENFDWQRQTYAQNFEQALEAYNYQKWVQNQMWEREDNAMQRKIADLKAAGLSPALAYGQGGSGSGPVVPVRAPERDAPQRGFASFGMRLEAAARVADITRTIAETMLLGSQAEVASRTAGAKVQTEVSQAEQAAASAYIAKLDAKYREDLEVWLLSEAKRQLPNDPAVQRGEFPRSWSPGVINYKMMEEDLRRRGAEATISEKGAKLANVSKITEILVPLLRLLK